MGLDPRSVGTVLLLPVRTVDRLTVRMQDEAGDNKKPLDESAFISGLRIWMPQPYFLGQTYTIRPDALGWLYLAKTGLANNRKLKAKGTKSN